MIIVYSSNNNKITHSYASQTATSSKVSLLGHHTPSIHRLRYELRWPVMLGQMLPKKRPLTKWSYVVCRSSRSTYSTISDKVREVTGRTLVCVWIHLECWLDKSRVEIVTWAEVGVANQQQFGYSLVSKFWQYECDRCGFNSQCEKAFRLITMNVPSELC